MRKESKMRVIIAGGGTGGHLYPGIAIFKALDALVDELEVLFVGARGGVEEKIFLSAGLPHVLLPGKGLRGASVAASVKTFFRFLAALIRGIRVLLKFKPDVVLGTGGYASAAVVTAAIICRKPRVLQEQNSVPGLVNRMLCRFANLILLSYEESRHYLPAKVVCAVVGNPVRFSPGGKEDRVSGMDLLDLDPDLQTVLVLGGSRGARSLNKHGLEAAKRMVQKRNIQFVIVAGDRDYEEIREQSVGFDRIKVLPFVNEMERIYAAADVVVSRAGASSVFELALFHKPTIFVPYPFAADDHQRKNVEPLLKSRAALLIDDGDLSPELLEEKIKDLLDDKEKRSRMENALQAWAKGGAAERAAEIITALVKKKLRRGR